MWRPFKNKLHNYQELSLIINLLALYVFLLSEQWIDIYALISLAEVHLNLIIVYRIMTVLWQINSKNTILLERLTKQLCANKNLTNLQDYFKL